MAVFIDHVQPGRAVIQDFPELTLVFRALRLALPQRRDVVDPQHPLAADKADMAAAIGRLRIGDQHVHLLAVLGEPDRFLVQDSIGIVVQRRNDACSMIEVMPEFSGIEEV